MNNKYLWLIITTVLGIASAFALQGFENWKSELLTITFAISYGIFGFYVGIEYVNKRNKDAK